MGSGSRAAILLAFATTLSCKGCGASQSCPFDPPPAGAVLVYSSAGGLAFHTTKLTVWADGRFETRAAEGKTERGQVPAARIEKLKNDISASGALVEVNGCWAAVSPATDGVTVVLLVRDTGGTVRHYEAASSGAAPAPVERAMRIARAFDDEVRLWLAADAGPR